MSSEYRKYEPVKNLFKLAQKIEKESNQIYGLYEGKVEQVYEGVIQLLPQRDEHPFALIIAPDTTVFSYTRVTDSEPETDSVVGKMEGRKVPKIGLYTMVSTEKKVKALSHLHTEPHYLLLLEVESILNDNILDIGSYRYHLGKNGGYRKEKEFIKTDISDPDCTVVNIKENHREVSSLINPKELETIGMFLLELKERMNRFKPELSE